MKEKQNEPIEAEVIDIFEKAALQAAQTTITKTIILKEENITNANIAIRNDKTTVKTWKQLEKAIDSEHAERFNRVLQELPDREFVRVYLKALDYFKPKVIREKGGTGGKTDTTINIQVNYGK